MDNFRKKFLEEANEHIADLEKALLELDGNPGDKSIVERVFRAMHSLKGGGAMFGFEKISDFTHDLENIYDLVRNGEIPVTRELLNITLASIDHLTLLLDEENEDKPEIEANHARLLSQIRHINSNTGTEKNSEKEPDKNVNENNVNACSTFYIHFQPDEGIFDNGTNPLYLIDELYSLGNCFVFPGLRNLPSLEKLDTTRCYLSWDIILVSEQDINAVTDVFIFVEDDCTLEVSTIGNGNLLSYPEFYNKLVSIRDSESELTQDILKQVADKITKEEKPGKSNKKEESNNLIARENRISSIRVASDKLDQLMNLVSELVTTQARLSLYSEKDGQPELMGISENVQKLSRQLRDIAFSIVLIPIENMLTRFHRLIRDLSNELKKEVDFYTEGTDTELDKTIIENLSDPLMHIVRNSMDHGIETPSNREKAGKPRRGQIKLKAFYSGANVHIQISDDGAGIDPAAIREKAIQKGIILPEASLSKKEILDLIFLPGFSTAKNITDVSGRGVGMDVVKRKIADIRGEVEVDSEVGAGTILTIKLPLTLSIIDGLLVKVGDSNYVIPLTAVDKIYAAEHEKLINTFNNIIVLDGKQVPYLYLRSEFGMPESDLKTEQVVVVRYEDKRIGLAVDNVVGEYQAVLKPLGKHYKDQDIISGATILGDGTVALVMDTNKAIRQFSNLASVTQEN